MTTTPELAPPVVDAMDRLMAALPDDWELDIKYGKRFWNGKFYVSAQASDRRPGRARDYVAANGGSLAEQLEQVATDLEAGRITRDRA